ncbi:spore coat protein CotJB, partial [Bacillus sp. SS-TM]
MTQSLPEEYYQLLLELQELDFVLVELTLYLDTHPVVTALFYKDFHNS